MDHKISLQFLRFWEIELVDRFVAMEDQKHEEKDSLIYIYGICNIIMMIKI